MRKPITFRFRKRSSSEQPKVAQLLTTVTMTKVKKTEPFAFTLGQSQHLTERKIEKKKQMRGSEGQKRIDSIRMQRIQ